MVQRNKRVGVTVVDEGWWRLRVQMEERGKGFADVHPVGRAIRLGTEGLDETLGWTAVAQVLGRIPEVQQIGDGIEDGHRLDGAAFPVDGVRSVGRAGAAAGGQQQAQVAARAAASDTQSLRVDAVVSSMMSDVSDRPTHVLEDLGHRGLRLRHVIDGQDGIPPAQ